MTPASAAATKKGRFGRALSTEKPPTAGPKMKPSPMAAPSMPMPAARRLSSVTSAMYACAAVMLAPQTPANARATTSHQNDGASA